MPGPNRGSPLAALALLFATLGASASAVPATLPARLAVSPQLDLAGVVPALFTGVLAGVLLSMALARVRAARLAAAGAVLQALAGGGLAVAVEPVAVVLLAAVLGTGFGLVEAAATALVRSLGAVGTPRRLVALTGSVAIVAAALPLLLAALPVAAAVPVASAVVVLLAVPAAIAAWRVRAAAPVAATGGAGAPRALRAGGMLVAIAALALALAVGAESLLAGHSAIVLFALLEAPPTAAALGTSAFWVLLATGRFTMAAVLRRGASPRAGLVVATLLASTGFAAAAGSLEAAPLVAAAALAVAAIGLGPIYSLVLGIALASVPDSRAARATAALIAAGALGGSALPSALLLAGLGVPAPLTYAVVAATTLGIVLAGLVGRGTRARRAAVPVERE